MSDYAPNFVTYFDFRDALPHPIPRQALLRLSKCGRFPAYVRPGGLQSEPLFLEHEVKAWVTDRYGKLLPRFCRALNEREGFDVKPPHHAEPL